jgi:hypothetical protein
VHAKMQSLLKCFATWLLSVRNEMYSTNVKFYRHYHDGNNRTHTIDKIFFRNTTSQMFVTAFFICQTLYLSFTLIENTMKTKLLLVGSLSFLFLSVLFIACKKDNKTVPVQLLLTDNPTDYDEVNIHIVGMQVKMNSDDAGWITIDSKDTVVNLLDLQNGITEVIAQDEVPEGVLKEVRFILGSDNTVLVDGISHDLQTPSAESSGLKIKIDKTLNETLNTFILDFDAALSVKEEAGNYKLEPVIRLIP